MSRSSSSFGGGHSEGIAGGIVGAALLVIVLFVVTIWATVKAIDLVIRAWQLCRGKSQALRIALISWLTLLGLLLVSGLLIGTKAIPATDSEALAIGLGVLLALATLILLITARVVEVKYRYTFASEPATLVQHVLRKPWWTGKKDPE